MGCHAAAPGADEAVTKVTEVYEGSDGSGADAFGSSDGIACGGKGRVEECYEYSE